ncbi:MAG: CBS domain-containing protein [Methanomicrobiales archaeon]|jgi:CBS domain-containing protein|nr:CBS domain-containing protein [Methanomicrobiales archaeon]
MPLVSEYMTGGVVKAEIPGNRYDVLKVLKRTRISGLPVLMDNKLVGIITRRDLLHNPEENQLALLMTPDPVTIHPGATIQEAAQLMVTSGVRRLPVTQKDTLVGLISIADIILAIARMRITIEIRNFVIPTFALWEETPLPLVGKIMEISGFEALPILSATSQLKGIISERDLILHATIEDTVIESDLSTTGTDDDEWTWESIRDVHTISYGISRVSLENCAVKKAMISNVIMVAPNATVSECALRMKRSHVDQLPVVDEDGKLKSMLFDRELIKVLLPPYT